MDSIKIFEFLNSNPVFYLATTEGNQPRVRAMLLYRADTAGILFHLGKNKEVHQQLQANPKVELCFHNASDGIQIRVAGEVFLDESLELKKEIVARHDFLKPMIEKAGYEALGVYRMTGGIASTWSMATIGAPKTYVRL
jgi:pyridoxamine 5'-phosphate oxidase